MSEVRKTPNTTTFFTYMLHCPIHANCGEAFILASTAKARSSSACVVSLLRVKRTARWASLELLAGVRTVTNNNSTSLSSPFVYVCTTHLPSASNTWLAFMLSLEQAEPVETHTPSRERKAATRSPSYLAGN